MTNRLKTTRPHISVAPMMDWTDRHYRYFMRQITANTRLYTEMVTTGALLHGDADRFLRFNTDCENPLALQLGGSDPKALAQSAKLGESYGYDEINLNCGCPSDRVQNGMFGACMMKDPVLVADCFEAMQSAVNIPVTIKCRIGVDELDSAEFLYNFVDKSVERGCKTFILHARKAWLKGLSPKQNREIPELNYQRVYDLKQKYPHLEIILNGGVTDIVTINEALDHVDGVMIGREAYHNPYFFAQIERDIFKNEVVLSHEEIAAKMIPYARKQTELYDTPVKSITRHILGLYHDCQGSKRWRRALSTLPYEAGADESVIQIALDAMIDFQENEVLKNALA